MVSRLHATTRPLFRQLLLLLLTLRLGLPIGRLERVALYIAGLILFTRMLARHRLVWVSVLKANARVRPRHYYCSVSRFASRLAKDTSIQGFHVRLWSYGKVKPVVVRNGATIQYLVTNALRSPPQEVLRRKRSRWDAEESFRDAKQLAGLEACQARVPQAAQRHIALVLLSLVALQLLKRDPSETAGQVKEPFQLLSITGALHAFPPKTLAKTA